MRNYGAFPSKSFVTPCKWTDIRTIVVMQSAMDFQVVCTFKSFPAKCTRMFRRRLNWGWFLRFICMRRWSCGGVWRRRGRLWWCTWIGMRNRRHWRADSVLFTMHWSVGFQLSVFRRCCRVQYIGHGCLLRLVHVFVMLSVEGVVYLVTGNNTLMRDAKNRLDQVPNGKEVRWADERINAWDTISRRVKRMETRAWSVIILVTFVDSYMMKNTSAQTGMWCDTWCTVMSKQRRRWKNIRIVDTIVSGNFVR